MPILAISRSKMHESWKRTAIKTATEFPGGFLIGEPIVSHTFLHVLGTSMAV
jgi:hypothetical protein